MDLSMPGMSGVVATRRLKELRPDLAIVSLTRHADQTFLEELLRAECVRLRAQTELSRRSLFELIRAAARDKNNIDPALTHHLAAPFATQESKRTVWSRHNRAGNRSVAPCLAKVQQQENRRTTESERKNHRGAQSQSARAASPSAGGSNSCNTPFIKVGFTMRDPGEDCRPVRRSFILGHALIPNRGLPNYIEPGRGPRESPQRLSATTCLDWPRSLLACATQPDD